jgi:autotransporter-associated beta strand protein
MLRRTHRLAAISAAAFAALTTLSAHRASAVTSFDWWTGPGTDWATAANWGGSFNFPLTASDNGAIGFNLEDGYMGAGVDPIVNTSLGANAIWFQNYVSGSTVIASHHTIYGAPGATLTLGTVNYSSYGTYSVLADGDSTGNFALPVAALTNLDIEARDNSSITFSGGISGTGALNITGSSNTYISSTANWNGALNITGGGTLYLFPNQNISGPYNVSSGVLYITDASALGTSQVNLSSTAGGGAALFVDSANTVTLSNKITASAADYYGQITGGGDVANYAPSLTLTGPIQVGGSTTYSGGLLGFDGTGNTTVTGTITASTDSIILKYGTGTLTISGNNDATWGNAGGNGNGDLLVEQGTVQLSNGHAIGDHATVAVFAGATLDLGGQDETLGGLTDANTSPTSSVTLGSATLTLAGTNGINASFNGVISGSGTVAVTDSADQVLSGLNTYTGHTLITNGTLLAGANVPRTGAGPFGNDGLTYVTVGNANTTTGAFVGVSGDNITFAKDIVFTAGPDRTRGIVGYTSNSVISGDLTLAGSDILINPSYSPYSFDEGLTLTGNINGAGGLVINSSANGNVILAGNAASAASSRDVTIVGGSLVLVSDTPAGSSPITLGTAESDSNYSANALIARGNITVARDITVGSDLSTIGGADDTNAIFSGAIQIGNHPLSLYSEAVGNYATTFSGAISGSSYILKTGVGTVVLANASNSFTGGVQIEEGTLKISSDSNMGPAPTVRTATNIYFTGYKDDTSPPTLSTTGSFNIATNRGIAVGGDFAGLNIADGTVSYGGVIAGSSVTVTKSGNGTLSLSGASTFTGGFVVRGGTVLVNAAVPASGSSSSANSPLGRQTVTLGDSSSTSADAPTLLMNGAFNFSRAITLAPPTTSAATPTIGNNTDDNVTFSSNLSLTHALNVYSSSTSAGKALRFTGVISGAQPLTFTGPGTTVLSGTNTFTGKVNLNAGTLSVSTIGNISTAGNLGKQTSAANATVTIGNATLRYTGAASSTNRPISLTASGATLDSSGTGALTLTAAITGTGSLTKTGSSTLLLTAVNPFTGNTTVQQGSLALGASASLASPKITINSGANLDVSAKGAPGLTLNSQNLLGAGSVIGNLNLNANASVGGTLNISGSIGGAGSVNPGNSPGILTASSVSPAGGLDFSFEFSQPASPYYGIPAASGNDVLHLTSASAPFASALTAANTIDLYLPTLTTDATFRGGFYTDLAADFVPSIQNATIQYFTLDASGSTLYNGQHYSAVNDADWILSLTTVADPASFDGVHTTDGYVTQISAHSTAITAVPLPTSALMGFALLPLAALYRRLRRPQTR